MGKTDNLKVAADHPCLAGHFPGKPIVPAVLILDLVLQALYKQIGPRRLARVVSAKFLSPLRPEQLFCVQFETIEQHRVRFKCSRNTEVFALGEYALRADS